MAKYDIDKFSIYNGKLYYDNFYATKAQRAWYKNASNQSLSSTRGKSRTHSVDEGWKKNFLVDPNTRNGRAKTWAKPLAPRNDVVNVDRGNKLIKGGGKKYWKADISDNKKGAASSAAELKGSIEWKRQIAIAIHQIGIQSELFRIVVGRRAEKVFQDSFEKRKFDSWGSKKWQNLSEWTLKKRARRKTGKQVLNEYGDLRSSIKLKENVTDSQSGPTVTRIYTDAVPANPNHYKKHTICYAGWHNEGEGTYGKGFGGRPPKHYIQRQFMGHSSKVLKFMEQMQRRYLFDMVFLNIRK